MNKISYKCIRKIIEKNIYPDFWAPNVLPGIFTLSFAGELKIKDGHDKEYRMIYPEGMFPSWKYHYDIPLVVVRCNEGQLNFTDLNYLLKDEDLSNYDERDACPTCGKR